MTLCDRVAAVRSIDGDDGRFVVMCLLVIRIRMSLDVVLVLFVLLRSLARMRMVTLLNIVVFTVG